MGFLDQQRSTGPSAPFFFKPSCHQVQPSAEVQSFHEVHSGHRVHSCHGVSASTTLDRPSAHPFLRACPGEQSFHGAHACHEVRSCHGVILSTTLFRAGGGTEVQECSLLMRHTLVMRYTLVKGPLHRRRSTGLSAPLLLIPFCHQAQSYAAAQSSHEVHSGHEAHSCQVAIASVERRAVTGGSKKAGD